MRVKIYNCIDLNNPLRDFEVEQTNLTVLELLEHSLQRLNLQNLKDNVTVYSDGQEVPCDIWAVFKLSKTKCLKFVIKPQDFFSIAMIIIALAVAVYTMVMLKKLKTNDKNQESKRFKYLRSKRAGKQSKTRRSDTGAVRVSKGFSRLYLRQTLFLQR